MGKLEQLKVLVRKWEKEKGMAVAYEICEFLSKNLKDDTQDENSANEGGERKI